MYLKQNPLCVVCHRAGQVVDHCTPVRIDPLAFYDPDNWMTMCHKCHNTKSATIDKAIKERPSCLLTYKARVQMQMLERYEGEGGA